MKLGQLVVRLMLDTYLLGSSGQKIRNIYLIFKVPNMEWFICPNFRYFEVVIFRMKLKLHEQRQSTRR